jgi:hypothetical protein
VLKQLTWGSFHVDVLVSIVGDLMDDLLDKDDITDDTLDLRVRSGTSSSNISGSGDGGVGVRRNCRSTAFGARSVASRSINP